MKEIVTSGYPKSNAKPPTQNTNFTISGFFDKLVNPPTTNFGKPSPTLTARALENGWFSCWVSVYFEGRT